MHSELGDSGWIAVSHSPPNKGLEVDSWKCIFNSVMEPLPQCGIAMEINPRLLCAEA